MQHPVSTPTTCNNWSRSLPYMVVKRLIRPNVGNFGCTWIEPDMWQWNGQMLITRWQKSNLSIESIRWHLLNANMSINYMYMMSGTSSRRSGLTLPVPEVTLSQNMFKWMCSSTKYSQGSEQELRQLCQFHLPDGETISKTCSITDTDDIL